MSRLHTIAGTEFDIAEFQAWNERMFRHYGNDRLYYHPNALIRRIQRRRIQTIVDFLDIRKGDSVLDAGCGEGHLFSRVPASARQTGIDLSSAALEIAASRNPSAEWIHADLHKMPFADHTFDKICCSEVIEHVPDPVAVIRELHRVVKPEGRVIITVPNEVAINRLKDAVLSNAIGRRFFPVIPRRTEWHLTEYTPTLLRTQASTCFNLLRDRILPWRWLRLGYGVLCAPK